MDNPGFRTRVTREFASVGYGLTETLSAEVEASFVRIDLHTPADSRRIDGFGDTRVLLRRTTTVAPHEHGEGEASGLLGLHWGEGRLSLGAGLSFPTGDPERPAAPVPVPNSTLQTGTGTYYPILSAVYLQSVGRSTFFGGVAARISGGENRFDYRTGEAVQASLGAAIPVSARVDLVPKVSYLYAAADELDGNRVFASGGHWVSLVPGVRLRASEHLDLEATLEIPVFRDLRTEALEPLARLSAGLTLRF